MDLNVEYSACCFTGHRILPREKLGAIQHTLEWLIRELCKKGCGEFICGGAVGFDMMAAETVIKMKKVCPEIMLVMALPCRDQHIRWRNEDRVRYENIVSRADKTIYLCESYITGCMHMRNKYMVDNSAICVAYFENRRGGTKHTIEYAYEKGCNVVNIAHLV